MRLLHLLHPALVALLLCVFLPSRALGQSPPVASWGFQEGVGTTAADGSGNGNTGTLLGPTWTIGAFGNGLTFDGVNDRVQVADSSSVDILSAITCLIHRNYCRFSPRN
jgi:hypothetical protein